jgi:hypothetical protein
MSVVQASARGTGAHAEFVSPAFASHEQRPRDLESLGLGAAICVVRPAKRAAWPQAVARARRLPAIMSGTGVLARATGYSLDGEYVGIALCRESSVAADICSRVSALGSREMSVWAMSWQPLDEFGSWDGKRFRLLAARSAANPL